MLQAPTPEWLTLLAREWMDASRPLLLVDEVRLHEPSAGEIVSFMILETDTRTACDFANSAAEIRSGLSPADGKSLIKGSALFGNRQRGAHESFRRYVTEALDKCASRTRVTTSTRVLQRYEALAPGGIRLDAPPGGTVPVEALRGPELVPVMNALKLVANQRQLGAQDVDVLLDRSAQLGLDPSRIGVPKDEVMIIGPGEFNTQADGSPTPYVCPSRFRLICPPQRSAFRDLLLLPDSLAYQTLRSGVLEVAARRLAAGEDFILEDFPADRRERNEVPTSAAGEGTR